MCKWLYAKYAKGADIAEPLKSNETLMWVACQNGHLKVCEWLQEVGAAADITKASNRGKAPMYIACEQGHLKVAMESKRGRRRHEGGRRRRHSYAYCLPAGPPRSVQVALRGRRNRGHL